MIAQLSKVVCAHRWHGPGECRQLDTFCDHIDRISLALDMAMDDQCGCLRYELLMALDELG